MLQITAAKLVKSNNFSRLHPPSIQSICLEQRYIPGLFRAKKYGCDNV